jgi:opacity protein-like surface antigen
MKIITRIVCSSIAVSMTIAISTTASAATATESTKPAAMATTSAAPSTTDASGLGLRVGAKAGVAVPTSKLGATAVFGIDAEYRLPMLDRLLGIAAEFAYSAPSTRGSSTDPATGDFSYQLDTRITSFALEAIARRAVGRFEPYGGAGYAITLLRAQTSAFTATTTENQTRAGFQLRGGCGYLLGPGHVFVEARYQFSHFDFESTGSASAGTFDMFGGYRFAL